jgi:hypothetical protein
LRSGGVENLTGKILNGGSLTMRLLTWMKIMLHEGNT